jgi:Helicase conserved C-terminal domain/SNF2-related domain/LAGLIDADG-like domain
VTVDDTKLFEYPLLDGLALDLTREYVKMLGRMNTQLSNVLAHARGGLDKSHGLYVIPGGVTGALTNDLQKAVKQKQSDAQKKQKKQQGPSQPGVRGGKWWRDKHGHVRYGKKPDAEDEGTRDWESLDDEEVKQLHESLEVVYAYSPFVKAAVDKHLMEKGINPQLLLQVFRDSNSAGMAAEELWTELAADSGASEEDAKAAFAQVMGEYKAMLASPEFKQKARDAVSFRKHDEERASQQLTRSASYSGGKFDQMFSGNVQDEAIRVLALMADMELLHVPTTTKEARESDVDQQVARAMRENIVPNKARLSALYSRLDETNGAQAVATYVAQMFRDMREGGFGFGESEDADKYFKDGADYATHWLAEGDARIKDETARTAAASEIERANHLVNAALENGFGTQLSDAEKAKAAQRLRELGHEVYKYIEAYNGNQGGQELGLIFSGQVSAKSLFKNDDALRELSDNVAAYRATCQKAMEAQANADFETPKSMQAGFDAMTKKLIADGKLKPGSKADLLDYQKQALNWMESMKRGILAFDTGLGKALRATEPVLTSAGWKPIGKLEAGERVYGSDGYTHEVLGVYPQGVRPLFEVTFSDGASVVCDEEHLWNVNTKVRNHRAQPHRTLTLRQIMAEGLKDNGGARHFIPVAEGAHFPKREFPVDPYTLGALLGDGSFSGTPRITTDKALVEQLLRLPAGSQARFKEDASEDGAVGEYTLHGEGGDNSLTTALREFSLYGKRSWGKFIPKEYLFGSLAQRFALLQGLLDTDGYFQESGKCLQFSSSSPELALNTQQLVWSLGGTAKMAVKEEPKYTCQGAERTGRPSYTLTIRLPEHLGCPFRLPRRVALWSPKKHYVPTRSIQKVRPVQSEHAVCIRVSSEDQLFVTKDYIVTHNTPMSIGYIAHLQELAKQGKISKEDARGVMVMPKGLTNQWPNEIRSFFPDAKVVSIGDDITNQADRIEMLQALQDGTLDADFVILSSSVVTFHDDTHKAIEDSGKFEKNKQGDWEAKEGVDYVEAMREFAQGDPMCSALRGLKGCVFFDEAHHDQQGLKKEKNVRNMAAREFLKDRERSFLLTATPMPNGQPKELFELMDLIHPGCAGPSVTKFSNRIATEQWNAEKGKMELVGRDDWGQLAKDIAPYVFRKSKQDEDVVQADAKAGMVLPPLVGDEGEAGGATHGLVMPPSWNKMWEQAGDIKPHNWDTERPGEEFVPASAMKRGGQLLRMHQQMMMSTSPRLLLGDDPANWAKYGYDGAQPKLDHLAGEVKKHFQDPKNHDRPIVVFSNWPGSFKHAIDLLTGPPHNIDRSLIGEVHGGVPTNKRNAYVEATNAGKIKLLFVGTDAGGAGLNLQKKSRTMRFLDQPWQPGTKQQAVGRVWRKGQTDPVNLANYYMKGTFDEKKLGSLKGKSATDVAASAAHLDEETLAARATNQTLQILGGPNADQIEKMTDEELALRIASKGLTGLVTPQALRQKFDLEPFSDSVAYKRKLQFGQAGFESQRLLANVKLKRGSMTKEEYKERLAKLGEQEKEWVRQNKIFGNTKVAVSKEAAIQPEPTYGLINSALSKIKASDLSDSAKAVLATLKKNGGSLTISDFVDTHLKEQVDKEVKRDKEGNVEDSFAHAGSVQKWWGSRKDIEAEVTRGFKELDKLGVVTTKGGATKQTQVPLPKDEEPSPSRGGGGRRAEPKATPKRDLGEALAESVEKNEVNYLGGWAWKFSGDHTKAKEYKKAVAPFGGYPLHGVVDVLKEEPPARRPKTLQGLVDFLGCTEGQAKRLVKQLHEFGVMS